MDNFKLLCIVSIVVTSGTASPTSHPTCIRASARRSGLAGVNIINGVAPKFVLKFSKNGIDRSRRDAQQTYKVSVSAAPRLTFSDVKISLQTSAACGVGRLQFEPTDFFQVRQPNASACPTVLHTSRKLPMTSLPPLVWTPPSCGTIVVKAVVTENGDVDYADSEGVLTGPLSFIVHVDKATRQERLTTLCGVLDRYLTSEVINSADFRSRHDLGLDLDSRETFQLDQAVKLRRSSNRVCCGKPSLTDQVQCFDTSRKHRIDSLCADSTPDLPFTVLRASHMQARERHCCGIFGSHRYSCFARGSQSERDIPGATALDFSLDETDPANDLSEFASQKDQDIISELSDVRFETSPVKETHHTEAANKEPKMVKSQPKTEQSGQTEKSSRQRSYSTNDRRRNSAELFKSNPERRNKAPKNTGSVRKNSDKNKRMGGLSRRLTSAERRSRRRFASAEGNFEDEGGRSVVKTLKSYQKKLRRLKLKERCCRAGAGVGAEVYGGFDQAWGECGHSGDKWIITAAVSSGLALCHKQFKKCCIEMSVSGPQMTSTEFREIENKYLESLKQTATTDVQFSTVDGGGSDDELNGPMRFDQLDNEGTQQNAADKESKGNAGNSQVAEYDNDEDEDFESELGYEDDETQKVLEPQSRRVSYRTHAHKINNRRRNNGGVSGRGSRFGNKVQQRRRKGRRTSRGSRERGVHTPQVRRRHGYSDNFRGNTGAVDLRGNVGAVDSREMANINDRRMAGVMDSREMAGAVDSREMAGDVMRDTPTRRGGRRRWSRRSY